jgi:hypothetical protein
MPGMRQLFQAAVPGVIGSIIGIKQGPIKVEIYLYIERTIFLM